MAGNNRIGIIGIGNVLIGDDAIGPYAVEVLRARYDWPDQVELIDAGTPGAELADILRPYRAVIVIDSVNTGATPGTLARIGHAELLSAPPVGRRLSHDPNLTGAILQLEMLDGRAPEVILIGLVPEPDHDDASLSPAAGAALSGLIELVLAEAARLGVAPRRRETPLSENIWWRRCSD